MNTNDELIIACIDEIENVRFELSRNVVVHRITIRVDLLNCNTHASCYIARATRTMKQHVERDYERIVEISFDVKTRVRNDDMFDNTFTFVVNAR